jgi:hypothetical protein
MDFKKGILLLNGLAAQGYGKAILDMKRFLNRLSCDEVYLLPEKVYTDILPKNIQNLCNNGCTPACKYIQRISRR